MHSKHPVHSKTSVHPKSSIVFPQNALQAIVRAFRMGIQSAVAFRSPRSHPHPQAPDICVDLNTYTLHDAIQLLSVDCQTDIPLVVWLIENPNSPIALPGKIDLYGHDCIHTILNQSSHTLPVEAFVLGFTMGNDDRTRRIHQLVFKFVASTFYPRKYRFAWKHFRCFDEGFIYGRSLAFRNLNRLDFTTYQHQTVAQLRQQFGLDHYSGVQVASAQESGAMRPTFLC